MFNFKNLTPEFLERLLLRGLGNNARKKYESAMKSVRENKGELVLYVKKKEEVFGLGHTKSRTIHLIGYLSSKHILMTDQESRRAAMLPTHFYVELYKTPEGPKFHEHCSQIYITDASCNYGTSNDEIIAGNKNVQDWLEKHGFDEIFPKIIKRLQRNRQA